MSIRVLIADDVSRVRQDLRTLLTLSGDIEVVGEAGHGAEVAQQAQTLRPDVVLMDLEMPVLDGFEATRRIKATLPACRVVVLTIHAGEEERKRALLAGADYFVDKGSALSALLDAVYGRSQVKQIGDNDEELS